jgi:hypothetical protein
LPWQGAYTFLVTCLLATGVAGTVGWLVTLQGVARRRGWAAPVGTVLFVLGVTAGLAPLTAQEHGQTLVPVWLGLLGLTPSAVGVVAVVQLWRDRA